MASESGLVQNEPDRTKHGSRSKVAAEHGTSESYVYRAEQFAKGVEAAEEAAPGAQEDFVRRWEMCFREYPDILTEPKNNEKLLIFIDRASRYLQTVKDRLTNDGNQNSQTV